MPKITNSFAHHSSHQSPENRAAKGKNPDKADSGDETKNHSTNSSEKTGGKFENLKPVSTLIDGALHSKHLLSKKMDDRVSKNNARSESHSESANLRNDGSNKGGRKFEGLKTVSTLINGALDPKHGSSKNSDAHVSKNHANNAHSPHQQSEPQRTSNNGRDTRQADSAKEPKNHQNNSSEINTEKSAHHNQASPVKQSNDETTTLKTTVIKNRDENNSQSEARREPENPKFNDNSAHENHELSFHQNFQASSHETHETSFHQNQAVSVNISDLTTVFQALKSAFVKQAAEAGLPINEQEKFAEKHLNNFADQVQSKGLENLLDEAGDFSLLNFTSSAFKAKITGNQLQLVLGETALADLHEIKQQNQTFPKPGGNLNPNFNRSNSNNVGVQRMEIEARLPLPATSSREFAALKAAIQHKVEEILQELGLNGEANEKTFPGGSAKTTDDLLLALNLLDGKSSAGGDKVLFAAALGLGTNAPNELRDIPEKGILAALINRSDKVGANNQLNLIALAHVLQHGSQAGFASLLESANADFSSTDVNGLTQLHAKLGIVATTNLVVGVVTMSVMTREVVGQLKHVVDDAAVGLSDSALAALQKAQNSLRDHLTTTDLIGAVGDLKHTPVTIGGNYFNFLPEVKEALNSLREARSRILSETMYMSSNATGIESQQRFSREAEVLLGITQRLESFLQL